MTPPFESYPESPLPTQTKVCKKCGVNKSIDDFYRRNDRPNRASFCKKCCNSYKPKQSLFPTVKICCCVDCIYMGEEQSVSNFYKNKRKRDGLQPWCKDCLDAASDRWAANNPEKTKAYWKEWAVQNPGKRKESSTRHTIMRQRRRAILKEMGITNEKRFKFGWAHCAVSKAKERAVKKHVPFDMSALDLLDRNTGSLPVFCPIFPHIKLDYDAGDDRRYWASIDRIVPSLGYVSGNICVISMAANNLED